MPPTLHVQHVQPFPVIGGTAKVSIVKSGSTESQEEEREGMTTVMEEEEGEESDKSDNEEAVCPICLNELDEGEDLLVCSSCHNHLHQHCMDICKWAELWAWPRYLSMFS